MAEMPAETEIQNTRGEERELGEVKPESIRHLSKLLCGDAYIFLRNPHLRPLGGRAAALGHLPWWLVTRGIFLKRFLFLEHVSYPPLSQQ